MYRHVYHCNIHIKNIQHLLLTTSQWAGHMGHLVTSTVLRRRAGTKPTLCDCDGSGFALASEGRGVVGGHDYYYFLGGVLVPSCSHVESHEDKAPWHPGGPTAVLQKTS